MIENMWGAFNVSTRAQLKSLEDESYKEATQLYEEHPEKAKGALNTLINMLDLRKILYDMYVWQRVDAVKRGIHKAQSIRVEEERR